VVLLDCAVKCTGTLSAAHRCAMHRRRKEVAARRAAQKPLWGPPPPANLTSTLSGELVSTVSASDVWVQHLSLNGCHTDAHWCSPYHAAHVLALVSNSPEDGPNRQSGH
jgi:hypothetical protein